MFQKGMSQQVFIFIFALILSAAVLIFGVQQLLLLLGTGKTVETLSFVEALNKEAQTYATFDPGSTKLVTFSLPADVNQVCFFNNQLPVQGVSDPVFRALLRADTKNNVFILPLEQFQDPGPGFFIPHLTIRGSRNPLCVMTPGKLSLLLETIALPGSVAVEVKERPS